MSTERTPSFTLQPVDLRALTPRVFTLRTITPQAITPPFDGKAPVLWLGQPPHACSSDSNPACFAIPTPIVQRHRRGRAARYGLPREHLTPRLQALAAVEILTSALEKAGRRLGTESLVDALRDRHGFSTSIGPVRFVPKANTHPTPPIRKGSRP